MKWALIGASDIAATQVLPALRQLGHEPVVVVGSDGERAARYATRNGVGYGTTSIEEALSAVWTWCTSPRTTSGTRPACTPPSARAATCCARSPRHLARPGQGDGGAAAGAGVVMATNRHLRNSPVIRALRARRRGALGWGWGGPRRRHHPAPRAPARRRLGGGPVRAWSSTSPCTTSTPSGSSPGWRWWRWRPSGWRRGCRVGRRRGGGRCPALIRRTRPCTCTTRSHPDARTAFEVFGTSASALATTRRRRRWTARSCSAAPTLRTCSSTSGSGEPLRLGPAAFAEAVAGTARPPCTGEDGVRAGRALAVTESRDRKMGFCLGEQATSRRIPCIPNEGDAMSGTDAAAAPRPPGLSFPAPRWR